MRSIAG